MMIDWQEEKTDDEVVRSQALLSFGAVAGIVMQFGENAPTTYAQVNGRRLGAFESWDAARAAVRSEVERTFAKC